MELNTSRYNIENLQRLCKERDEESLILEFKACNELKVGSTFRDKNAERPRTKEDVLNELTRDVTAFLNSAGGTIIYGILESKSRAKKLDHNNAFKEDGKQDDLRPEKVIQWLRSHVQPPPKIDVYRVFEKPGDQSSPWYLVVDIPQGEQAYMAKDHRFYKRVGATVQPMEQYEVLDVMNRTRGAALELRLDVTTEPSVLERDWVSLRLSVAVTSTNYIASEYGAFRLAVAYPVVFDRSRMDLSFRGADFHEDAAISLEEQERHPRADSMMIRWGAHAGNIIFPGHWFDFFGNSIVIEVPGFFEIPKPTYLLQTELFTINSLSKKRLYAIQRKYPAPEFRIDVVEPKNYDHMVASFWETYDLAKDPG